MPTRCTNRTMRQLVFIQCHTHVTMLGIMRGIRMLACGTFQEQPKGADMERADHCPQCRSVAFLVTQRPDILRCLVCGCDFQFQYVEDLSSAGTSPWVTLAAPPVISRS